MLSAVILNSGCSIINSVSFCVEFVKVNELYWWRCSCSSFSCFDDNDLWARLYIKNWQWTAVPAWRLWCSIRLSFVVIVSVLELRAVSKAGGSDGSGQWSSREKGEEGWLHRRRSPFDQLWVIRLIAVRSSSRRRCLSTAQRHGSYWLLLISESDSLAGGLTLISCSNCNFPLKSWI